MQRKLGTKTEISQLITSLRDLNDKQRSSKNKTLFASLALSILAPIIASIRITEGSFGGFTMMVGATLLGPRISAVHPNMLTVPIFLKEAAGDQQGLRFFSLLSRTYSNFNTPKQLKNHAKKLKKISGLGLDWEQSSFTKNKDTPE